MKIIDILDTPKDCVENCDYSTETLVKSPGEDIAWESNESWSEDESDSEKDDELNLSFREGMKRCASDEFCHDLKRIKFDNNVRDLANNFSFQLGLVIKIDSKESKEEIKKDNINSTRDIKSAKRKNSTNS